MQDEEDDIDIRLLRPGSEPVRPGAPLISRANSSTNRDGRSSQKRLTFDDENLENIERTYDQIKQDDGIADILNSV